MVARTEKEFENVGASKGAIAAHYDVDCAFWERILGPSMAYSAGHWIEPATQDTNEQAQVRKFNWHADWSGASRGRRVLEVGCGWGTFIRHLLRRNPKAEITGLTLSEYQATYVRGAPDKKADIKITSWQQFKSNRPFDAIVSIEAIEHFAKIELTPEQRLTAYRDFFQFCHDNLVQGGRLSLQTSAFLNVEPGREREYDATNFYPESGLPHVSELVAASDGLFHVVRMEVEHRDCLYSVRGWLRTMRRDEAALRRDFGDAIVQSYMDNFKDFIAVFASGIATSARVAYEKRGPNVVWKG